VAGYLEGKAIAITGAGRGIGRGIALLAASEGASVVVNDLGVEMDGSGGSTSVAQQVVDEITAAGGTASANTQSVTSMEGGASIVQQTVDSYGKIDGLVAVAGVLRERMIFNMSEEEWDVVVATHLKGTFTVMRAATAAMKGQGFGSLIGFTSGAFSGSIAQANYSAAKGGIVSLMRSIAGAMYRYDVRANIIAPVARTRMSQAVPGALEMGDPEDVAPMVVYLLSDAAKDVTGQIYTCNGSKIAVWNQPAEVREMRSSDGGRWNIEDIEKRFSEIGTEKLGLIEAAERMREAAAKAKASGKTENV
jgi:NAD(P)-dependent dehydrogenase (short-subunit alcohol dehydrogenase family)